MSSDVAEAQREAVRALVRALAGDPGDVEVAARVAGTLWAVEPRTMVPILRNGTDEVIRFRTMLQALLPHACFIATSYVDVTATLGELGWSGDRAVLAAMLLELVDRLGS